LLKFRLDSPYRHNPVVAGQFDAVAAILQGGIAKWRREAASTSI
jgi:hypothetical protein